MTILLTSYILVTCACLLNTYYVFKLVAKEGDGAEILLLILISITPVINFIAVMMIVFFLLGDILIRKVNKQLEKRKP